MGHGYDARSLNSCLRLQIEEQSLHLSVHLSVSICSC